MKQQAARKAAEGHTYYGSVLHGDRTNHMLSVRFDYTDGYIGITQGVDRILITPKQAAEMQKFIGSFRVRAKRKGAR